MAENLPVKEYMTPIYLSIKFWKNFSRVTGGRWRCYFIRRDRKLNRRKYMWYFYDTNLVKLESSCSFMDRRNLIKKSLIQNIHRRLFNYILCWFRNITKVTSLDITDLIIVTSEEWVLVETYDITNFILYAIYDLAKYTFKPAG